jgi:hypothetical protein
MPNIPIFIEKHDVELILKWLKEDSDIAIISNCSFGEGKDRVWKWKASQPPKNLNDGYYQIWHIPSGKIFVEGVKRNDPDWVEVNNPFEEYEAYPYNNNREIQNLGNMPQFFEFEVRVKDSQNSDMVGLSNFSWIGSRYQKAPDSAKKWWSKLRRFITNNSTKINGNGINSDDSSKFFCFAHAYESIKKKPDL